MTTLLLKSIETNRELGIAYAYKITYSNKVFGFDTTDGEDCEEVIVTKELLLDNLDKVTEETIPVAILVEEK